jgi:hypothetical protein
MGVCGREGRELRRVIEKSYMGCRHAVGDKRNKCSGGRLGKEGKAKG